MLDLLIFVLFLTGNRIVDCDTSDVSSTVNPLVRVIENESTLIPCQVPNPDTSQDIRVRWYHNEELIGDTHLPYKPLPNRMHLYTNYTLQIVDIKSIDSGNYTCEIVRIEPWSSIKQTHTILVLYRPRVETVPADGYLEVKKGELVEFGCNAIGEPSPIITWYKNGEIMELLSRRDRIQFRAEDYTQGGKFTCSVSNNIGEPVFAYINVVIQDAPTARAVRSRVHTSRGLRAALEVKVSGGPLVTTAWYKNGEPVKTDSRVVISILNDKHQLVFRNVRDSDFGNYTFRVENSMGMSDVSFVLTGTPCVANFKVDPAINKPTATSFTLVWSVDSYSPIIEYNLWVRPFVSHTGSEAGVPVSADKNPWMRIVVPAGEAEGPIHSCSYTIRSLTPSALYETMVSSRNQYGWSKASAILRFSTEPGVRHQPSTAEYNDNQSTPPTVEEYENVTTINGDIAIVRKAPSRGNNIEINKLFIFLCIVFIIGK